MLRRVASTAVVFHLAATRGFQSETGSNTDAMPFKYTADFVPDTRNDRCNPFKRGLPMRKGQRSDSGDVCDGGRLEKRKGRFLP